jgi:hypothetical protein
MAGKRDHRHPPREIAERHRDVPGYRQQAVVDRFDGLVGEDCPVIMHPGHDLPNKRDGGFDPPVLTLHGRNK